MITSLAVGPHARAIEDLFGNTLTLCSLIFALVAVLVTYAVFKFRDDGKRKPSEIEGHTRLEIAWTIAPVLVLVLLLAFTVKAMDASDSAPTREPDLVVTAHQWWWSAKYKSGVVVANEIHVPVGKPLVVGIESADVIHDFWVPELARKIDAVPGRSVSIWLQADKPGTYLGQCAEYCGLSHANMRFRVIAKSPSDFQEWLSEQQQGPVNELTTKDAEGKQVPAGPTQKLIVNTFACTNCHVFDDSSQVAYGPNLTHLASRSTFASGSYPLTRDNLVNWVKNAPSMIPMSSQDCRLPPGEGICVGMPSFIENTPPGQQSMTQQQAEDIADFLLEQK